MATLISLSKHKRGIFRLFFVGTSSYNVDLPNKRSCLMAKKVSKRRPWTEKHLSKLKKLAKKKTPAARIAKTLNRTEGATRQKAQNLGVSLDSRA